VVAGTRGRRGGWRPGSLLWTDQYWKTTAMEPTRKVKGTTARALRQFQHLPAPEVQSPANNPGTASSGEDSSLLEPDNQDLGIELEKMFQSFQEP
jgi:hypothetical protein